MGRKKSVVSGRETAKEKPKAPSEQLSQRAYAEHRGCALSAVQRAIKDGRLSLSLTTNSRGHKKIISAEVADREWASNTRSGAADDQAPGEKAVFADGDYEDMSFNEARRRREIETWLMMQVKRKSDELDLGERAGELIPIEEARETVLSEYMAVKTKILGLPTRARQRLPHLSERDVTIIDDLVREALEALSNGE